MKPWQVRATRRVYDGLPHLAVDVHEVALPDGTVVDDFHRVIVPDFAITVAVTDDDRFLFLRQYKHGLGGVSLTLPAGHIEGDETPLEAARRELVEETGHDAAAWQALGDYVVNGNQRCGVAHVFAATGAAPVRAPDPGDLEEMELVHLHRSAALVALRSGAIGILPHAAALSFYFTLTAEER